VAEPHGLRRRIYALLARCKLVLPLCYFSRVSSLPLLTLPEQRLDIAAEARQLSPHTLNTPYPESPAAASPGAICRASL